MVLLYLCVEGANDFLEFTVSPLTGLHKEQLTLKGSGLV